MVKTFAEAIMAADADAVCNAGYRDLAGGNNAGLDGGEWGGVYDAAAAADQGDGVDAVELGGDAVPGQSGASFGNPDEQEGEPAEQDVGADRGGFPFVRSQAATGSWGR